jgi:hypothetical protein
MADFNIFRAHQVLAMRAVLKPDGDFLIRRMFRWYSKNFSTPLHEVESLPLADVLTAYYEDTYDAMDVEHREILRARLAENAEERAARLEKAQDDQDASEDFLAQVEEEEIAKREKEKTAPTAKKPSAVSRGDDLPGGEAAPPDIKMSFVKDKEFQDALARWDQR